MDKVFENAKDLHVRQYIVYQDSNGDLFHDEDCTKEVKAEDCLDLFFKGVAVCVDGVYYKAISCSDDGELAFAIPEEDAAE